MIKNARPVMPFKKQMQVAIYHFQHVIYVILMHDGTDLSTIMPIAWLKFILKFKCTVRM